MGVWFVKWGAILGALAAGAGWIAANGGGDVAQGGLGGGVMSFLSGLLLDAINGRGQNAAGNSRTRSRTRTQSQSQSRNAPPKVWESFRQHRDWQYQDNTNTNNNNDRREEGMIQGVIGNIMEAAEMGGWLAAAQRAMDGFQGAGAEAAGTVPKKQPERKAKAKAKAKAKGGSR